MPELKYKIVLLDADETLLDFKRCESEALKLALAHFGYEAGDGTVKRYSKINLSMWRLLEQGKIERQMLKEKRFELFFEAYEKKPDIKSFNAFYEEALSNGKYLLDGALDFLRRLKALGAKIYIVTNGTLRTQVKRVRENQIMNYVEAAYISEEVGYSKPSAEFFDYVFKDISLTDKGSAIILGDSLSSDMLGGRNAGIATCLFARGGKPEDLSLCDYVIDDYDEFFDIVLT